MNQKQEQKLSLLSKVAHQYYVKRMTQQEISELLFISRSSVSRLLSQAEEENVVEIKINYYYNRDYHLEDLLKKKFNLKDARVLSRATEYPGSDSGDIEGVGKLAAEYLDDCLKSNTILGLSWGRSVGAVVNALHTEKEGPLKVVQIMGATVNEVSSNSAQQLVRRVANLYNGEAYYLNSPLFTEDDYVCSSIKKNPSVANTLKMAAHADIILTGIGIRGSLLPPEEGKTKTTESWMDLMTAELIDEIDEKHAVGTVAAQFFDISGNPIDCKWARNCIGLKLESFKKVPKVIGVAIGKEKVSAIRAAILGNYINVLISDSMTVQEILKLEKPL